MHQASRLVWLDEAEATSTALVGAKAARLAEARRQGLPVLNGFVVPVEASASAVRGGAALLGSRHGSGAARTAVFNHGAADLASKLASAAEKLGETLVVRSSSRAEAEGIWAGAFSTYLGLRPEEVAVGVIGCWASVFNPETLRRAKIAGIEPGDIGMGVLVQPELASACGGTATVGDGGEVTVVATRGHPGPIGAGLQPGEVVVLPGGGMIQARDDSRRDLGCVARLARQASELVGCRHIEWAKDENGDIYLLQTQPGPRTRPGSVLPPTPRPSWRDDPYIRRLVRMMVRYPGPMGERWVWPWAIGMDIPTPLPPASTSGPPADIAAKIRKGAEALTAQRWRGMAAGAGVKQAWSALGRGDPAPLLALIRRAPPVNPTEAESQFRRLVDLAASLTDTGVIPSPGWMWYLDPDALDEPDSRKQGLSRRIGLSRWDPFIYEVTASQGKSISGRPSASGWGVGRLRSVRTADDAARVMPREVIVARQPIGNLAPLLWNAAGLITSEGGPGAHLFEVAEWMGVPAVCGANIRAWTEADSPCPDPGEDLIVAVDGDRGRVHALPPS
ncbi:MAG: PEP-utilizing enzyme [bacterium]|nr:PEP-utilizing enzyme [bacterium]